MEPTVHVVDVFAADESFSGNPVAVVSGVEDLTTAQLQRITQWFNLSETTFLLPPTQPGADYRVRIFSLTKELPFAGHPTLGTAHAWSALAGVPAGRRDLVQECGVGLVPLRRDGDGLLSFAAPPLLREGPPSAAELSTACEVLRIDPARVVDAAWIDNGPGWLGIRLASADEVLAVAPEPSPSGHVDIGIVGPHDPGGDASFEVRAFFSDHRGGIVEDPVTGSLNASLAQWLYSTGVATGPYVAAQGTHLGRRGRVHVEQVDGQVWVGGRTRTHVRGEFLV